MQSVTDENTHSRTLTCKYTPAAEDAITAGWVPGERASSGVKGAGSDTLFIRCGDGERGMALWRGAA